MIIWFTARKLKILMVLLAITLVLTLSVSRLPHVAFVIGISIIICIGGLAYLVKNSWTQTSRVSASQVSASRVSASRVRASRVRASQVSSSPGQEGRARSARAEARARKRGDILHPDATVTLSDERAAAGVDDVFAKLNSELVGLVPVKKKVEEVAALLLVDRVRQRFGLAAPRPNLHMCFTGAPGTR